MIFLLWISLAAAAALLTGCGGNAAQERPETKASGLRRTTPSEVRIDAESPQLRRIRTVAVENHKVALDEVVAPGKIESIPTRISRVAMPVPGRITRLMTDLGAAVRQGQTLLSIESPEVGAAAAALQQAEARLSESRAGLAKAEADLARTRDLHEHRAIAQKEVIVAEAALAQAQSEVQQSEAMRREALSRLKILGLRPGDFGQEVPIRAPVSGKVIEISVAPGDFRTDTSAPLLTIADLSVVHVAADVPESHIRLIHLGEIIEVALTAFPQESFRGRVTRITDLVDPQTRTIKVLAEMPNPHGRLRPEMFAQIRHQENFRKLPVVPTEALIQSDGRTAVWIERSAGWFEQVRVEAGRPQRGIVPILSGVTAGEQVVVDGVMLLQNWQ